MEACVPTYMSLKNEGQEKRKGRGWKKVKRATKTVESHDHLHHEGNDI